MQSEWTPIAPTTSLALAVTGGSRAHASGSVARVRRRSFAAIAMLAGALPFDTRKHPGQLMFDVAMGKVVPLGSRRPELAPPVLDAIAHAMAPRRENRPASASELAREWQRAFGLA